VTKKQRAEEFPLTAVRRMGSFDEEAETIRYWLSRPPDERLAEVERLRREYYGEDYEAQCELPRSFEIVKRKLR
jgi:hypothetical protein